MKLLPRRISLLPQRASIICETIYDDDERAKINKDWQQRFEEVKEFGDQFYAIAPQAASFRLATLEDKLMFAQFCNPEITWKFVVKDDLPLVKTNNMLRFTKLFLT